MLVDDAILTPDQVALELSLNIETVRSLMRKGIIPATKVGGCWRTTRRALYDYLENQIRVASGIRVQRKARNGQRHIPLQGRRATMGKRRKETPPEPIEEFFPR